MGSNHTNSEGLSQAEYKRLYAYYRDAVSLQRVYLLFGILIGLIFGFFFF